jgi:TDG/mug DNA glycosylase family protein
MLPDVIAPRLPVLFCGINPGLRASASGHHFDGRGNRFWRVVHLAGFTPMQIAPENDRLALEFGFGLITAVDRPTAGVDDLSKSEIIACVAALDEKIRLHSPRCIAFLGKAPYAAISSTKVEWGPQPGTFGGASVWVLPNASGRNRRYSLDELVEFYRQLHRAVDRVSPVGRHADYQGLPQSASPLR